MCYWVIEEGRHLRPAKTTGKILRNLPPKLRGTDLLFTIYPLNICVPLKLYILNGKSSIF